MELKIQGYMKTEFFPRNFSSSYIIFSNEF